MLWELFFMLVVLKIPVAYLCAVVWWAVRAEPPPLEGASRLVPAETGPDCSWSSRRTSVPRRGPLPRGGRHTRPLRSRLAA